MIASLKLCKIIGKDHPYEIIRVLKTEKMRLKDTGYYLN